MATIFASGKTELGDLELEINGNNMVKNIVCTPERYKRIIQRNIKNGTGWIANGYHPKPNTMLQALAYCRNIFGEKNVSVDGHIKPIESKRDVIY